MTEAQEVMRQHIEETKSKLWDKLDTLESQVSEAVQLTSAAVSETVEAVQEAVSSVTGSVKDSVQSVSNAFDVSRQIERHPWAVFGGSVIVGYLAFELLNIPTKKSVTQLRTEFQALKSQDGNGHHSIESVSDSSAGSYFWAEMRGMLTGTLMGAVSAMVSRGVPKALDYLAKTFSSDPNSNQNPANDWGRSSAAESSGRRVRVHRPFDEDVLAADAPRRVQSQ